MIDVKIEVIIANIEKIQDIYHDWINSFDKRL